MLQFEIIPLSPDIVVLVGHKLVEGVECSDSCLQEHNPRRSKMELLEATKGLSPRGSHSVAAADLRVELGLDLVPLLGQSLGVLAGKTGGPCWWQGDQCCGLGLLAVGVAMSRETLRENGHCRGEAVVLMCTHGKGAEGCCRCGEQRWLCKNIGE